SDRNETLTRCPLAPPADTWRCHSPVTGSTLMTSAPRSPSRMAANGPDTAMDRSSTRYPSSTPTPLPSLPVRSGLSRAGVETQVVARSLHELPHRLLCLRPVVPPDRDGDPLMLAEGCGIPRRVTRVHVPDGSQCDRHHLVQVNQQRIAACLENGSVERQVGFHERLGIGQGGPHRSERFLDAPDAIGGGLLSGCHGGTRLEANAKARQVLQIGKGG